MAFMEGDGMWCFEPDFCAQLDDPNFFEKRGNRPWLTALTRLWTSVTGPRPSSDFAEQNQSRWRVPLMRSFRLPQRGSCSRSLGNVLRFVVSQAGCRQDAGSMQFRRVHLISVLSLAGDGPEPDIIGTASLRDLGSLRSDRRSGLDQAAASILKFVPSTHMRCSTTAMRRARATIARFRPRRFAT